MFLQKEEKIYYTKKYNEKINIIELCEEKLLYKILNKNLIIIIENNKYILYNLYNFKQCQIINLSAYDNIDIDNIRSGYYNKTNNIYFLYYNNNISVLYYKNNIGMFKSIQTFKDTYITSYNNIVQYGNIGININSKYQDFPYTNIINIRKNYSLYFYDVINIGYRFINTIYDQQLIITDNKVSLSCSNPENVISYNKDGLSLGNILYYNNKPIYYFDYGNKYYAENGNIYKATFESNRIILIKYCVSEYTLIKINKKNFMKKAIK